MNETIEDIVREMRDRNEVRKVRQRQYGGVHCNCSIMPDDLPKVYADRIEKAYQEKDRLIEKLKSHLSTAIKELAPKCVDCSDVCDTCDCRRSAWIPFAKLLIVGGDYDDSDYESLPLVSMTVNRTEIENLKDENERLHSALQHVLKVELNQVNGHPCADGDYCTSSEFGVCDHDGNEVDNESIADALSAVGKAQRIYKKGEE